MCAMNDAIPATRLTTASELVRVPAAGTYMGPVGPKGTELDGATCWPAIWVGIPDGCAGGGPGISLGDVLTDFSLPGRNGARRRLQGGAANAKTRDQERHVGEPGQNEAPDQAVPGDESPRGPRPDST